ncbi:hypothetical protein [Halorarius halobius]|uniref:hypothetical protein n=1 Tax=Halorarius halobius TaxID=2962671 RepID=UPI0020CD8AF0|nr:hypothetical protein [Halorarius halobius]
MISFAALALGLLASLWFAGIPLHVGGLSGSIEGGTVPSWLSIGTGGLLVGVSFLFTSFMTDHERIRRINDVGTRLPSLPAVRDASVRAGRLAGVVVLLLVVATGYVGPQEPLSNLAILVVWSGWWAGYTMSVYLVGNSWPVVNPWRTLAALVPTPGTRAYPERLGAWPAVVGLLGLVLVEVVTPLAEDPQLLATLIVAYTLVTVVGAATFGVDAWFEQVDPVARVFHLYGQLAPVQRTDDGLALRLPVAALSDVRLPDRPGEVPFVVALLWATTFDGLVTTTAWADAVRVVVGVGVPPLAAYVTAMAGGFGLFLGGYRLAAGKARDTADTYVTGGFIGRWFAPSLLPIAAGYHLAHYLDYLLTLLPVLGAALASPFTPTANPVVLVLPGWFGLLALAFVLLGHLLALWVAHSFGFRLFPGVLAPIRSQYPFVVVMMAYTTVSLWVVAQPFTQPPYT